MTNREKYAEQILDIAVTGNTIAIDKKGNFYKCSDLECEDCIFSRFDQDDCYCSEKIKKWSEQEYVEPPVDWSKVPVDTKILVRGSEDGRWKRRHFARYESNIVFAWNRGCTSYSVDGYDDAAGWKYAKLAEEGE